MRARNLEPWGIDTTTGKLSSAVYSGSRAGWGLDAGHFKGYIFPIAVHPRPDSETAQYARHRINAIGQKYRIPISVGHGAWPFKFEILNAPAGATIGQTLTLSGNSLVAGPDYGVFNIESTTVPGTYQCEVVAIDQNNIKTYFKWSLNVSDSNWVYLDTSAATNGSGTLASPFNTLASLVGMRTKGVLVRACTVDWGVLPYTGVGLNIAKVFVPYNGETVIFNQGTSTTLFGSESEYWFSGLTFKIPAGRNNQARWMLFEGADRVVFFENIVDLESLPLTGGRSNASFVQFANVSHNAENCVFINNQFNNISERDFILTYSMRNLVIEGNTVSNSSMGAGFGHGFYLKMATWYGTVRNNRSAGITNNQKLVRVDSYPSDAPYQRPMDFIEVCYNSYYKTGTEAAITSGLQNDPYGDARYFYKNSVVSTGFVGIQINGATVTDTITVVDNVIMSDQGSPNGYGGSFAGEIVQAGNIYANLASGMLDSNCRLQGAYLSNLGTRGAEVI